MRKPVSTEKPLPPNRKPRMKPSRSQKETPGPLNRKRPRKGSRGQRGHSYPACLSDQSANSAYRIDATATHRQISSSKPAGPLSQDTLSLGGSFFAARMQTKRNPGSSHRREGREREFRGAGRESDGFGFTRQTRILPSTNGAAHSSPGQRPGHASSFHRALKGRPYCCLAPSGLAMFSTIDPRALPWAGIYRPFGAAEGGLGYGG